MKQLSKMALSILLIAMSASFFTSCKKETVTTYVDNPSPTHAEPIIIWFGKTNTLSGCKDNYGICLEPSPKSMDEWQNYSLQINQGKGQAWATKLADGSTTLTLHAGTTKLSTAFRDTVLRRRLYPVDEDTYIRKDLIDAAYKNAGIPNPPDEIKIARGSYPVEVVNAPPVIPDGVNKWILDVKIKIYKNDLGDTVINVSWEWVWVEP